MMLSAGHAAVFRFDFILHVRGAVRKITSGCVATKLLGPLAACEGSRNALRDESGEAIDISAGRPEASVRNNVATGTTQ